MTVPSAYARAGVDVAAGARAVDLIRAVVGATHGPEVLGGIGGFAGLYDASALRGYRRPLLATSTDGVGTKVVIARRMGRYDTIGFDLVGMVVDDLVVCGARPLFLTDYIACGRLDPERIARIVRGVAAACLEADCALVGGETAEHPGVLGPDDVDLAGAATGVVEADGLLGAHRVEPGDALVAMAASGLHANGYSLVRRVLLDDAGWTLDRYVPDLGRTLGEELLEPTTVYARAALGLAARPGTRALAHVTGGGLAANLARVLPGHVRAEVERGSWSPPPVFRLVEQVGDLDRADLEGTLNMGVGMVAVVAADSAGSAVRLLADAGIPAWVCGRVEPGDGTASLVGEYRG